LQGINAICIGLEEAEKDMRIAVRSIAGLAVAAMLACLAHPVYAQDAQNASIDQKLKAQFTLTKMTADSAPQDAASSAPVPAAPAESFVPVAPPPPPPDEPPPPPNSVALGEPKDQVVAILGPAQEDGQPGSQRDLLLPGHESDPH
jgi:outer membrane biosynthesis protein TonB